MKPFRIRFERSKLDDLRARLESARLARPSPHNENWERGMNDEFMRDLLAF